MLISPSENLDGNTLMNLQVVFKLRDGVIMYDLYLITKNH
jgi:hypothetical protein